MTETDSAERLRKFRRDVIARLEIHAGEYCCIYTCQAQTGPSDICMNTNVEMDGHNKMHDLLSDADISHVVLHCEQDDCDTDCYCVEHCGTRFYFRHTDEACPYEPKGSVFCTKCMEQHLEDYPNDQHAFESIDAKFKYPPEITVAKVKKRKTCASETKPSDDEDEKEEAETVVN